jgi:hypothetical protein
MNLDMPEDMRAGAVKVFKTRLDHKERQKYLKGYTEFLRERQGEAASSAAASSAAASSSSDPPSASQIFSEMAEICRSVRPVSSLDDPEAFDAMDAAAEEDAQEQEEAFAEPPEDVLEHEELLEPPEDVLEHEELLEPPEDVPMLERRGRPFNHVGHQERNNLDPTASSSGDALPPPRIEVAASSSGDALPPPRIQVVGTYFGDALPPLPQAEPEPEQGDSALEDEAPEGPVASALGQKAIKVADVIVGEGDGTGQINPVTGAILPHNKSGFKSREWLVIHKED